MMCKLTAEKSNIQCKNTSTKYEKKIDYKIYKYTVHEIPFAKSSRKMSNVQCTNTIQCKIKQNMSKKRIQNT